LEQVGDPNSAYKFILWGGRFRHIPEENLYPRKTSLKVIHDLWYQGTPDQEIRPFKHFKGNLLHNKGEAQALSRASKLVAEIDKCLPINYANLPAADKDSVFVTAFEEMVKKISENGKKKIDHSMTYGTLYEKHLAPYYNKKKKEQGLVVEEGQDEEDLDV
jgi:hypothetical protein